MYLRNADESVIAPDMDPDPQMSPVEVAQRAQMAMGDNTKIGAERLKGLIGAKGVPLKPYNKLPEGEDPAGWFIVGGRYVNCDGKTPEEIEKNEPTYFKNKLAQAQAEIANQLAANARTADALEHARIELQQRDQKIAAYEAAEKAKVVAK